MNANIKNIGEPIPAGIMAYYYSFSNQVHNEKVLSETSKELFINPFAVGYWKVKVKTNIPVLEMRFNYN